MTENFDNYNNCCDSVIVPPTSSQFTTSQDEHVKAKHSKGNGLCRSSRSVLICFNKIYLKNIGYLWANHLLLKLKGNSFKIKTFY